MVQACTKLVALHWLTTCEVNIYAWFFNHFSTPSYLIVYKDVSKFVRIIMKVLYVIREISSHKTMKNLLKTNFNHIFWPKLFFMCKKYHTICSIIFVDVHCIWVYLVYPAIYSYIFQEFYNSKLWSNFYKVCM